jgi:hypothetical protein
MIAGTPGNGQSQTCKARGTSLARNWRLDIFRILPQDRGKRKGRCTVGQGHCQVSTLDQSFSSVGRKRLELCGTRSQSFSWMHKAGIVIVDPKGPIHLAVLPLAECTHGPAPVPSTEAHNPHPFAVGCAGNSAGFVVDQDHDRVGLGSAASNGIFPAPIAPRLPSLARSSNLLYTLRLRSARNRFAFHGKLGIIAQVLWRQAARDRSGHRLAHGLPIVPGLRPIEGTSKLSPPRLSGP